jgi:integrase
MRRNLTAKLIQNLQPSADRRYEFRDRLLPGFGVRVSVGGKKTWFAVGRVRGRQVRHTIGTYPTVTLGEAREAARLILKDIQLGLYAPAKPVSEAVLPTLHQMITLFIEIYAKPKNRSWKAVQATFRKFSSLNDRLIVEITRADVVKVLDDIAARGAPIAANRAMSAIKKLFAWSLDRGVISVHPLVGLHKPGIERSRDRILTERELRSFWHATEELGFPFGPAFQLMALTGQRRGEVVGMQWSQLLLNEAVWTIPANVAKNGRVHQVPLPTAALEIIQSLPRLVGSDLVFTTTGVSPISGFGRAKDRLDFFMEVGDWRLHDLRRTAASGMARLGVAPHVIEKVLNHASGQISGVAAVYNRHGYKRRRQKPSISGRRKSKLLSVTGSEGEEPRKNWFPSGRDPQNDIFKPTEMSKLAKTLKIGDPSPLLSSLKRRLCELAEDCIFQLEFGIPVHSAAAKGVLYKDKIRWIRKNVIDPAERLSKSLAGENISWLSLFPDLKPSTRSRYPSFFQIRKQLEELVEWLTALEQAVNDCSGQGTEKPKPAARPLTDLKYHLAYRLLEIYVAILTKAKRNVTLSLINEKESKKSNRQVTRSDLLDFVKFCSSLILNDPDPSMLDETRQAISKFKDQPVC